MIIAERKRGEEEGIKILIYEGKIIEKTILGIENVTLARLVIDFFLIKN